jgi:dephospho-CoA kinase
MDKPWRVGLTGGVASGKSTAARYFESLGAAVIDLDQISREVLRPGSPVLEQVFEQFGTQLREPDNSLNRRALRAIVFADPAALKALEAITQGAILARASEQSAARRGPYQIIVNPLLVEKNMAAVYDRVLLIDCPEELQLERLIGRDGVDARHAAAMLAAQSGRAARQRAADDIIENSGDLLALAEAVQALHQSYLRMAGARAGSG